MTILKILILTAISEKIENFTESKNNISIGKLSYRGLGTSYNFKIWQFNSQRIRYDTDQGLRT